MPENKSQVFKGTLDDIVDMSSGLEFWIRLDKESYIGMGEEEEKLLRGKRVEIHVEK